MDQPEEIPPAIAAQVFGSRLPLAERYARLLATDGIDHGLIGPRELPRLWSRHLVNCALVTDALSVDSADSSVADQRIVDVGSGAGLPGLVIAIRRPDLYVDLVESMQRRCQFLTEAVTELGLEDRVRVVRGRADDRQVVDKVGHARWVTARAVAPLDRLARWCLPLLRPGGTLLAMKGSSAEDEVDEHRKALTRLGATSIAVETFLLSSIGAAEGDPDEMVRVVRVERGTKAGAPTRRGSTRQRNQ